MTFRSLAFRCIMVTGADRKLDLAIDRATCNSSVHDDHLDRWPDSAKNFTSSIDTALSIMPAGWTERYTVRPDGMVEAECYDSAGNILRAIGHTRALALCSVVLEVLAQLTNEPPVVLRNHLSPVTS